MVQDQQAKVEWRDGGVPVSTRFDDPYFSLDDGLAETRHVFLAGNDLPGRFGSPLHVAELGFGSGLNFLATWAAWEAAGRQAPLVYTSFEAFPLNASEQARALQAFPDLGRWARRLLAGDTGDIAFTLVIGDARETLADWKGQADAWYLDGFSPAKNPELWGADLMEQVAKHTAPGGTFATYTAAGHVRRSLGEAGFVVERRPGFGRKRHMSVGRMDG